MELYERIRALPQLLGLSQAALARSIGMSPQTFAGWLRLTRQDNLWPALPAILSAFPQVSRSWLYFDEGEPFDTETAQGLQEKVRSLEAELARERQERRALEEELRDASRVNRALAMRLVEKSGPAQGKVQGADGSSPPLGFIPGTGG